MKKTYISSSNISFPLTMGKGYRRINFIPLSAGGSYYISTDKAEIDALDAHPYLNKLFRVESEENDLAEYSQARQYETVNTVKVTDIVEARDYLIDMFGYKAGDLRSRKAIMEAGAEHNIAFEGI
jgi:hypothetical protein